MLRYFESWKSYGSLSQATLLTRRYSNFSISTASPITGRVESQGNGVGIGGGTGDRWFYTPSNAIGWAAGDGVIVGMTRMCSTEQPTNKLMSFDAPSGTRQIMIQRDHISKKIQAFRGNAVTLLATGTHNIFVDDWPFIEVKGRLADSGGYVKVRVNADPTLDIDFTGDTLQSGGSPALIAEPLIWVATGSDPYYCGCIYVADTTGGVDDDFLGDCESNFYLPAADDTPMQWLASSGTNRAAMIDEPGNANDATDFIKSSIVGDKSSFTMGDIVGNPTIIYGWQAIHRGAKDASEARAYRINQITNGANVINGADYYASMAWVSIWEAIQKINPDTSLRYTKTDFNALKVQAELRA